MQELGKLLMSVAVEMFELAAQDPNEEPALVMQRKPRGWKKEASGSGESAALPKITPSILRKARIEKGVTMHRFQKISGCSLSLISRYERGKEVSSESEKRLAEALRKMMAEPTGVDA